MKKKYIFFILLTISLILLDQCSKMLIVNNIKGETVTIINNLLKFTYVENTGVAFGLNSNSNITNIVLSIIVIVVILRFTILQKDKIDIKTGISIALIISGGIGNLIDRIFRGKVIDFMDISDILNFPMFNVADILIVVGWILFVFFMAKYLFTTKIEDVEK